MNTKPVVTSLTIGSWIIQASRCWWTWQTKCSKWSSLAMIMWMRNGLTKIIYGLKMIKRRNWFGLAKIARTLPSLFDSFWFGCISSGCSCQLKSDIKSAGSACNVATVVTFVCQARGKESVTSFFCRVELYAGVVKVSASCFWGWRTGHVGNPLFQLGISWNYFLGPLWGQMP